jgi:catechol 2,3-dioxygenase-like lactoylglutathione lyase family enzyme
MKRVTGIGGIFFNAKDPAMLRAWYKTHLGIDVQDWGGAAFVWADEHGNPFKGTTAWLIGSAESDHFAPSKSSFMINYRVDDLAALLQALRDEGCHVLEKTLRRHKAPAQRPHFSRGHDGHLYETERNA